MDTAMTAMKPAAFPFWKHTRLSLDDKMSRDRYYEAWSRDFLRNSISSVLTKSMFVTEFSNYGVQFKRATPSAGAIYPVELVAVASTAGSDGPVARLDAANGRWRRLKQADALALVRWAQGAGMPAKDPGTVHLMVLVRVGRSVMKYGKRGLLYALLDAGHLCANLVALSEAGQVPSSLSILPDTFGRAPAPYDEWLNLAAVASLSGTSGDVDDFFSHCEAESAWLGDELERQAAETVASVWSDAAEDQAMDAALLRFGTRVPCALDARAADLLRARRSARGFGTPSGGDERALSLLAEAASSAVWTEASRAGLRPSVGIVPPGPAGRHDMAALCMGQTVTSNAETLVVMHGAADSPAATLRQTIVAGALGQMLYLAAAKSGAAITCIGAFDDDLLRRASSLDQDAAFLSLYAVGAPVSEGGAKPDRDGHAHSHGVV